jgi:hypothetical protein
VGVSVRRMNVEIRVRSIERFLEDIIIFIILFASKCLNIAYGSKCSVETEGFGYVQIPSIRVEQPVFDYDMLAPAVLWDAICWLSYYVDGLYKWLYHRPPILLYKARITR